MDKSFNEDENSLPKLPDSSGGSSVSTDMENECNNLLEKALLELPSKLEELNENMISLIETAVLNQEINLESEVKNEINTNEETNLKEEDDQNTKKATITSFTVVSDLIDLSDQSDQEKNKMNQLFLSPSSSSETSSSSSNHTDLINNFFSNNYQQGFDSSSDANPRKNSPIPASPPTNIEIQNETSSLEHMSFMNNYESAFKRVSESNHLNSNRSNGHSKSNHHSVKPKTLSHNELPKGDKMATCLDKWFREFKGQVLSEFEKTRLQIYQEQQKKLLEEKEKQTSEISKLKKEVEILRETIKVNERNLLKKDEAIENITKALEKQREKNELQRVMMEWKYKRLENAKEAFTTKLADKYYSQRLKLKMFFNWQYFQITRHKSKVEKACKKKAEEVCYDLATNYENKIKKLEEELNSSRHEIEKYKIEMAKNEENMRKALMRGVCALNMEAMSIFNEQSTTGSNTNLLEANIFNNIPQNENFQIPNCVKSTNSLNDMSLKKFTDRESKELARKVKTYCESSLSSKNITSNSQNISAVAKAKLQLLNSKNSNEVINDQVIEKNSHEEDRQNNQIKFYSNNKIFDELTEHNLMLQKKTNSKLSNVKSKVGSLPQSSKNLTPVQLSSSLPPYRSVVIEKHTKNNINNNTDDISIKTTATKVKYTPPSQPATVFNTVITSS
ncbi:unnamed protein product [Brachionus calyciflorus]|uniref:Centrosomal protein POC5 n=1 Tax=Brachionus calyciflorus TaxID=104777 RepID=A0A813WHK6_9BILA|nr:unnamed protein product [Brachionus calyciflorus]